VPTSSAINTSLPFKSGPKNASAHLMNLVSEKTHHTSARINGDGWTLSTIETPGLKEDSLFRSGRLTNAHPDESSIPTRRIKQRVRPVPTYGRAITSHPGGLATGNGHSAASF